MAAPIRHVMVDLETLGTVPGCVGFSIGAVEMNFDSSQLGSEFYKVICVESSLAAFLQEDPDTIKWWDSKPHEAREALIHARSGEATPLAEAMEQFNAFLLGLGGMRSIRLYGNGADFDNPILRVMWQAADVLPFNSKAGFFGGRCYRTLKSMEELFGPAMAFEKLERQGVFHNALDDAKSQAVHLMSNVARIRGEL
jgi:hypothetical protein